MNAYNYIVKQVQLRDGEKILHVFRRHWSKHIVQILISIVLLSLPFIFLVPLFEWDTWGIPLFFVILIIAIFFSLRAFVVWYLHVYVFTNRRVIHLEQRGLFSKCVTSIWLPKIRTISYEKTGVLRTVMNVGDVYLQVAGKSQSYGLLHVTRPHEVQECLQCLQEQEPYEYDGTEVYITEGVAKNLMDHELVEILGVIREAVGDKRFALLLKKCAEKQYQEEIEEEGDMYDEDDE